MPKVSNKPRAKVCTDFKWTREQEVFLAPFYEEFAQTTPRSASRATWRDRLYRAWEEHWELTAEVRKKVSTHFRFFKPHNVPLSPLPKPNKRKRNRESTSPEGPSADQSEAVDPIQLAPQSTPQQHSPDEEMVPVGSAQTENGVSAVDPDTVDPVLPIQPTSQQHVLGEGSSTSQSAGPIVLPQPTPQQCPPDEELVPQPIPLVSACAQNVASEATGPAPTPHPMSQQHLLGEGRASSSRSQSVDPVVLRQPTPPQCPPDEELVPQSVPLVSTCVQQNVGPKTLPPSSISISQPVDPIVFPKPTPQKCPPDVPQLVTPIVSVASEAVGPTPPSQPMSPQRTATPQLSSYPTWAVDETPSISHQPYPALITPPSVTDNGPYTGGLTIKALPSIQMPETFTSTFDHVSKRTELCISLPRYPPTCSRMSLDGRNLILSVDACTTLGQRLDPIACVVELPEGIQAGDIVSTYEGDILRISWPLSPSGSRAVPIILL
ncbi:hypothetical protein ONZ45_g19554 [Pleurotus djamor]|nr:hypothetical protein ONZ45_g19554 [Pleurotus djamor]